MGRVALPVNEITENVKEKIVTAVERNKPRIIKSAAKAIEFEIKKYTSTAIDGYYMFPQGRIYERTGTFDDMKNSVKIEVEGNSIYASIGDDMSSYPGMFGMSLDGDVAWNYMFEQGEHGHGKYNIGYSMPPIQYVQNKIDSGMIQKKVDEIATKEVVKIVEEVKF